ncbi:copper transpport protein [Blastocladiella emersonii ATCC 22665]|nr:copper transpport protein [Blastocladiella emersonii ATCC 22665]
MSSMSHLSDMDPGMDMGGGGGGGGGMPGMDHGGGSSGGGMDMDMSMLWNWSTRHFMVVFESWHVHTALDFYLTLLAVFLLALGYERIQAERARLEDAAAALANKIQQQRARRDRTPSPSRGDAASLDGIQVVSASGSSATAALLGGSGSPVVGHAGTTSRAAMSSLSRRQLYIRTALMATSYFLSIFLMLIFMTFNGWLIIAAVTGAATGFHLFRAPGSTFGLDKSCCD